MIEKSLAFILAGGKGDRLKPLTDQRAKPAVPFSRYRIVDHNTSAIIHAGIEKILFLTQYEPRSLDIHTDKAYDAYRSGEREFRTVYPSNMRFVGGKTELEAYRGTADAVLQNLDEVTTYNDRPDHVLVFSADHISDIDVREMMINHHREDRDLTIAVEVRKVNEDDFEIQSRDQQLHYKYGVIHVDGNDRVTGFSEKPIPSEMPGVGKEVLVSMGNYIFHRNPLAWAMEQGFGIDFGNHVLPGMVNAGKNVFVYRFNGYWRDVGDVPSYFAACMDLNNENPPINYKRLNSEKRPVITVGGNAAPTRVETQGKISTIAEGCEIYGNISNCVLGQNVLVGNGSSLRNTVVFPNVEIEPGATVQNAIIDKNNIVTTGTTLGYDKELDARRGYTIVPKNGSYIVVVPRVDPR